MSGRTTLYTFSIEGMEGIVNIVAYTVTDAENTLKEWLNPGVGIKLLRKDKVTLGKEYREINTQNTPAICEYSGLRPVEGYKETKLEEGVEMYKIGETEEEKAYRRGYIDGYDEGLYDGENK